MAKTVLSESQQKILDLIAQDNNICERFYLTGGTALAEFYLKHRLSEDLDFFSEEEFDSQYFFVFFKKYQKELGIKKIEYQQSFNRNIYFLYIGKEIIKIEFTYFPFLRIEKKNKKGKLFVDSLVDIAVNKIFTIYQNPRSRDFIDLYFIIRKTRWKISDLIKKVKVKFDWDVDILQLGGKFILAKEVRDYPLVVKKINHRIWQDFFIKEAKRMSKDLLG